MSTDDHNKYMEWLKLNMANDVIPASYDTAGSWDQDHAVIAHQKFKYDVNLINKKIHLNQIMEKMYLIYIYIHIYIYIQIKKIKIT